MSAFSILPCKLGHVSGVVISIAKDYLVHEPVVEIILYGQYDRLWNLSAVDLHNDETISLIVKVRDEIIDAYKCQENCKIATNTLVTKILMGTLGCTPAYDRYFIEGIKAKKVANQTFGEKSLKQISKYYIDNLTEFESIRKQINSNGVEYPQMKLLDMYFWQIGYDLAKGK